jgi:ribosomal protein S27E
MLIPIPTGRKYQATIVGRQFREVTCENCGSQYVYVVKAVGGGSGSSPMFLNNDGARAHAVGAARMQVERRLRELHLPVPCPDCGWYQHMVQIRRRRRLSRWMVVVAIPLAWLAFRWCVAPTDEPVNLHAGLWLGIAGALAVVAVIFHFSWLDNMNPKAQIARDPTSGGIAMRRAEYDRLVTTAQSLTPPGNTSSLQNAESHSP